MTVKVSAILVAVLVLSCVGCGSCTPGTILNSTLVQLLPGTQQPVLDTVIPSDVLDVECRVQDAVVVDDPWWLKVNYSRPEGKTIVGWVADYYVSCGNAGNCDVAQCSS